MKSDINAPQEWYLPTFAFDANAEHILQNKYNTYIFRPQKILDSSNEHCLVYGSAQTIDNDTPTWRLLFINKTEKSTHLHILKQEIGEVDDTSLVVIVGLLELGSLPSDKYLY